MLDKATNELQVTVQSRRIPERSHRQEEDGLHMMRYLSLQVSAGLIMSLPLLCGNAQGEVLGSAGPRVEAVSQRPTNTPLLVRANVYEVSGDDLEIIYETTGGPQGTPRLSYRDATQRLDFSGDQIRRVSFRTTYW